MAKDPARRSPDVRYLLKLLVLSVIYFITAWLGLKIGAVNIFATLIWPPTGIALAALLIGETRLWPAIALAAFLVNWLLGAPLTVALGMAAGNTLEAIVGVWLLNWVGFRRSLERLRDVFALIVLAGFLSTLISATFGATSLYLTGIIRGEAFRLTWSSWWFGDVMGNLIVAPFLLVWSSRFQSHEKRTLSATVELVFFGVAVTWGGLFLLTDLFGSGSILFPQPYLIFPLLMIVAIRLSQRWTITAIVIVAVITLYATATGHARFQADSLSLRLFQAQIFLAVVTISEMVLAATVMERRHREEENAKLYLEAHEALLARDEFLSIASHELKTPLTSLMLRLQMLSREINKNIAKQETILIPLKIMEIISVCEDQCKRLSGFLESLLDLTRIRLGKLQLTRENVDLCQVINAVVEQFRGQTIAIGVSMSVQCESPIVGFWDKVRIEQIISNLISNALKYGEKKPISISAKKDEVHGTVKLSVQDQGPGIPSDMQEKIFERFERAGMSGQKISGLGLGLYICRQIVEAHGGNIQVKSDPGNGSTFVVELPSACD